MSHISDQFTQREAAAYLSENGLQTHESDLSRMGKYGRGPRFERFGGRKSFHKKDLDQYLREQLEQKPDDAADAV